MVSPVEALQARAPARFTGRQWVVLLVLVGTGFMLSVDFSILNVALPAAGAGVGLEPAQLPWITSAYALPAAGFTLLFGRLADLLGRRRLLLAGLALLAAASLLAASPPGRDAAGRPGAAGPRGRDGDPGGAVAADHHVRRGAAAGQALGLNGALPAPGSPSVRWSAASWWAR
jgi:MFS family permease